MLCNSLIHVKKQLTVIILFLWNAKKNQSKGKNNIKLFLLSFSNCQVLHIDINRDFIIVADAKCHLDTFMDTDQRIVPSSKW